MQDKIKKIRMRIMNNINIGLVLKNKKISILAIMTFIFILSICNSVFGYTGKGTQSNPYIIETGGSLKSVVKDNQDRSGWIYIAINDTVAIKDPVFFEGGNFVIYAKGANRTIRRSRDLTAKVNSQTEPKYCFYVSNASKVVFGHNITKYKLTLEGSKDIFTGAGKCSGFLRLNPETETTIGKYCVLQNAKNNISGNECAPIKSQGKLFIYGEIKNCEGINGGAIKINNGTTYLFNGGKIDNCIAKTEGGAVHVSVGGVFSMEDGQIYSCLSREEGGAVFSRESGKVYIKAGSITNNTAVNSAGGVFAGFGSVLYVGTTNSAPTISNNRAGLSGGGIRCNGGSGDFAGGTTYIYGAKITNNYSGRYGGGIACGVPGANEKSKIYITKATVSENTSDITGGGVWIGDNVNGTSTNYIIMSQCDITKNISNGSAGGVMCHSNMLGNSNMILSNKASGSGGGIFIDDGCEYKTGSDVVSKNTALVNGNGIYLQGLFKIFGKINIDDSDTVYLDDNAYIDIVGELSQVFGNISTINSKNKSNGTKLVRVNYGNAKATDYLYSLGDLDSVYKKQETSNQFEHKGLSSSQLIRAGDRVSSIGNKWIIISEKYNVNYDKNIDEDIVDVPKSFTKIWNENINISDIKLVAKKYKTNDSLHWNTKKDGLGNVIKPGGNYNLNGNITLYAQWILKEPTQLFIYPGDRYYLVGQKVELNGKEILSKTRVEDDVESNTKYNVKIRKIVKDETTIVESNDNIFAENFINTSKASHYKLTLFAESSNKKISTSSLLNIYILDDPNEIGAVRFISKDYIYTLAQNSKYREETYFENLKKLLNKKKGEGVYVINITSDDIRETKRKIKNNNYKANNNFVRYLKLEQS